MRRTALIWDDALAAYRFTDEHPLNPRRLELTVDLIRALDLFGDHTSIVPARTATDDELRAVHDVAYLEAVRLAPTGALDPATLSKLRATTCARVARPRT